MILTQYLRGPTARELPVLREPQEGDFAVRTHLDAAARETVVRVRTACSHLDRTPRGVVRLDQASATTDLAVAVAALGIDPPDTVLVGELALDGRIRPVRGIYPYVQQAHARGWPIVVPASQAAEAGLVPGATVYAASSLAQVVDHFEGRAQMPAVAPTAVVPTVANDDGGQTHPREPEIAEAVAAGKRTLLFVGAPSTAKILLARRTTAMLGPMTTAETLTTTAIHSVAGLLSDAVGYVASRPFRAPHHTVSVDGLVGAKRPGEISLAHNGVLLLDEVNEFRSGALHPLLRAFNRGTAGEDFPAVPRLVIGTAQPCACGYQGSSLRACSCTPRQLDRYRAMLGELSTRFEATIHLSAPLR